MFLDPPLREATIHGGRALDAEGARVIYRARGARAAVHEPKKEPARSSGSSRYSSGAAPGASCGYPDDDSPRDADPTGQG